MKGVARSDWSDWPYGLSVATATHVVRLGIRRDFSEGGFADAVQATVKLITAAPIER